MDFLVLKFVYKWGKTNLVICLYLWFVLKLWCPRISKEIKKNCYCVLLEIMLTQPCCYLPVHLYSLPLLQITSASLDCLRATYSPKSFASMRRSRTVTSQLKESQATLSCNACTVWEQLPANQAIYNSSITIVYAVSGLGRVSSRM